MPSRINGIGTTYIGQKNLQVEQGVCESCNRPGPLSNYETRLWFTVFFIPVIPLARQQILRYCPRCTRHRAMPVAEWQKVQANAISSAMAKVDANPDSPEHAVSCHATLAACGKQQEASQYAEAMLSRFSQNADLLMYLGGWYERTGQSAKSDACFERALAADPQNPAALRAAAIGLAQQNKPREAEAKLATFQPLTKNYEPQLFYLVATAYQRVGDHESALRLFKMLATTTPSAAKEKKFRAAVRASEAALGQVGTVLAPVPLYKRKAVIWMAVAAAVVALAVGLDRYFAQNREVFVVNGMMEPLLVKLDGGAPVQVPPQRQMKVSASEGEHTIAVVEPATLAHEERITIPSNFWGRWRGREVNIVDPAHSAVVAWEESVYAADRKDQKGNFQLHVAEPLTTLSDIDYKFEAFPPKIQVDDRSKKVTKHRVGLENAPPLEILMAAPDSITGERRIDYLEAHLATTADRAGLLNYYWQETIEQQQLTRGRDFLKHLLDKRPVDVESHRMYQSAAELTGQSAQIVSEYDALIAKEPDSADLMYLRGRLEPYGDGSAPFYKAALRKDPNHSFTWSANGFRLSSAGKFEEALAAIEKAIAGDEKRGELKATRRRALQALGRHDQVTQELRNQIKAAQGSNAGYYPDLIDALAFQGKNAEAEAALNELIADIDRNWPEDPMQLKLKGRLIVAFESKKYEEVRAAAMELKNPTEKAAWTFMAYLCDGKPEEAGNVVDGFPATSRGPFYLCVSVAERSMNKVDQSQKALQQAIASLAMGTNEERIVAQWLRNPPADLNELLPKIADLALDPDDKVTVLLALAGSKAAGYEKLIALAEKLNAWPSPRRAFVNTTLAAMR